MNKIEEFARLLENDQIDDLKRSDLSCDCNILNCKVSIKTKKKYTCVDVGGSGKYMIDNETGEIFGIMGYGKVNKKHVYGTLDTIYMYYWGRYAAIQSKSDRNPYITKLMSSIGILTERGLSIDENGKLYGKEYGEKKIPEPPKAVKSFIGNKYEELTKDLLQAKILAIEEASKVDDSGTCNLDGIFLTLKGFNEESTVQAIKNSGLSGFLRNAQIFGKGYLIGLGVGQAYKREKAADAMYNYLDSLGYDVSHWCQID
jgi:hypothetical protein